MQELSQLAKALGGMPLGALIAAVVLAGFALAAYAIYAVLSATKERH
jgi:hypothetical protein